MSTINSVEIMDTHQWDKNAILALFSKPLLDLLFEAQTIHRQNFPANHIQLSALLSIKSGNCSENCAYCAQSAHHKNAPVKKTPLLNVEAVVEAAKKAKAAGATRFCMGAAWKSMKEKDMLLIKDMIKAVKAEGMETCVTLGLLTLEQALELKHAGLDYYNHNLNTAPEYHDQVVTTHTFEDRLATLDTLRKAGLKICCGGIIGMGETREHRASFINQLANSCPPPDTVPINHLVPIPGTPFAHVEALDPLEIVRTIAVARITMPKSTIRLSAGRESLNESTQTLCFLAGANSMFYGENLLTVGNAAIKKDNQLLQKLGVLTDSFPSKNKHK